MESELNTISRVALVSMEALVQTGVLIDQMVLETTEVGIQINGIETGRIAQRITEIATRIGTHGKEVHDLFVFILQEPAK